MFGWIANMFGVESLLNALAKAEGTPEGQIAKMLLKANHPEKMAAYEAIKKIVSEPSNADKKDKI